MRVQTAVSTSDLPFPWLRVAGCTLASAFAIPFGEVVCRLATRWEPATEQHFWVELVLSAVLFLPCALSRAVWIPVLTALLAVGYTQNLLHAPIGAALAAGLAATVFTTLVGSVIRRLV